MDFTSLHCQFSSVAYLCNLFLKTGFQRYIQTLSLRDHDILVCFLSILSVPCLHTPLSPNFLIPPTLFFSSPPSLLLSAPFFWNLHTSFNMCLHAHKYHVSSVGWTVTHTRVCICINVSCKHTFIPTMLREFTK